MSSHLADESKSFIYHDIFDHEQSIDFTPRKRDSNITIRFLLYLNVGFLVLAAILLSVIAANTDFTSANSHGCFDGEKRLCFLITHLTEGGTDKMLDAPIVWERRTFNSSVDIAAGSVTDWFRPESPSLTADWESVLDVGRIRVTDEERAKMDLKTTRLREEDGYAGTVEVFHQLHCLASRTRTLAM
jgi:Mycotoxin biosynthesis protein UstYa